MHNKITMLKNNITTYVYLNKNILCKIFTENKNACHYNFVSFECFIFIYLCIYWFLFYNSTINVATLKRNINFFICFFFLFIILAFFQLHTAKAIQSLS